MKPPEPVRLELHINDAVEAIRIVAVLEAITRNLWARFGDEMSEYLIGQDFDLQPSDPFLDDPDDELPF